MAAPTTYNQFELGTTTYTDLVALKWLPGAPQSIVHLTPNTLAHPSKFYGRGPGSLEGVLQCAGSSQMAFLSALQTETVRHASWVGPNAVAVYMHVYAGEVTSIDYLTGPWGTAANTKLTRISFRFVVPDQRLYLYSSDAVLLGS